MFSIGGNRLRYVLKRSTGLAIGAIENPIYKHVAQSYDINGYNRIYHVHVRKTGGTSLNQMFLALAGKPKTLFKQLIESSTHRIIKNGKVYVGWNKRLIQGGDYFYGYSHIPYHQLHLPKNTYTITILRDPVKRVVSYYNMLLDYKLNKPNHVLTQTEGQWVGNGFKEFLNKVPKKHLLNQLYMFSENFDVIEALDNIAKIDRVFFTDRYKIGLEKVSADLNVQLQMLHSRKSDMTFKLKTNTKEMLLQILSPEYQFIKMLKK